MQITNLEQIKFNCLSEAQYQTAKEAGELVETEFYLTPTYESSIQVEISTSEHKLYFL